MVPDLRAVAKNRVEKAVWNFGGIRKQGENLVTISESVL